MPVDLKQNPKMKQLPLPPDKSRWLIVIALCVVAGATLALYLWPRGLSTHSAWFWYCTLVTPFAFGLAGYIIRLRHYENKRDRILWWNHLHQKQYDEQIILGQRAVGVLGMSYVTPIASNKLVVALLRGGIALQTQYSLTHQSVLTTASLSPPLTIFRETGYQSRLESLLKHVVSQLNAELLQFTGNLSVRLLHDGTLDNEHILDIWQKIFPASVAVHRVNIVKHNDGVMWIDEWLDRKDASLVLSIEINLFLQPRNQQAESVSALLLASPSWLERQHTKPQIWIHRPVVVDRNDESVTDVACWGKMTPDSPWYLWRSQVNGDVLVNLLQSMDKQGYLKGKKGEMILDDVFGKPGTAVGNIMLICACEHATVSGLAQWLIADAKTIQMVIVRPA